MLLDAGCVACQDRSGPVCPSCQATLMRPGPMEIAGLDACRVRFRFDGAAKSIIAALKYRRQRRLARWLAAASHELVPRAADALTWMPSTPERRRSRGYDQAQELARELSRRTGVPLIELLHRSPADARQTGLSRAERQAGPTLSPAGRAPQFVVVVDDVVTTGSSMRSAASTLRSGGAQRVAAVALTATPFNDTELNMA